MRKNAEIKLLKSEQNKKGIDYATLQDLHHRITLLTAIVTELKLEEKNRKDNLKNCQAHYNEAKKEVEKLRETIGKPESSIVAEIEQFLETFHVSRPLTMVAISTE